MENLEGHFFESLDGKHLDLHFGMGSSGQGNEFLDLEPVPSTPFLVGAQMESLDGSKGLQRPLDNSHIGFHQRWNTGRLSLCSLFSDLSFGVARCLGILFHHHYGDQGLLL